MSRESGLGDIACRVLLGRNVAPEGVEAFLDASLRRHLPNPSDLKAMDEAAERLSNAVISGETIGIFGDYDVDGACSSALLTQYLRDLGLKIFPHIPDRMKEGYGPNSGALNALADRGASLVICTDCGTTAHEILNPFAERCDLIVLDHHKPEGHLLPKAIVVNPNRLDCTSGQGHLCATGVAFLMIVALRRALIQKDFFGKNTEGKKETGPDLFAYLDIVALATICDVMQLRGVNRAFVRQGLKILAQGKRPGLAALGEVAGLKKLGHSIACGFSLGPRINAGGRIGKSTLGIDLLLSKTYPDALPLARELDETNARRQEVEGNILQEAMKAAEQKLHQGRNAVFLYAQGWHPGVVGIVAGRIKEKFNRPVFIGSMDKETGIIKGSARSIEGLDVGQAVISAVRKTLLIYSECSILLRVRVSPIPSSAASLVHLKIGVIGYQKRKRVFISYVFTLPKADAKILRKRLLHQRDSRLLQEILEDNINILYTKIEQADHEKDILLEPRRNNFLVAKLFYKKSLLLGGGGHAMAAGFALHPEQGDAFEEFLDEALKEAKEAPKRADLIIDAVISAAAANVHNADEIAKLAPFGPGNEEPYLAILNVRVKYFKRIGKDKNTLRVTLEDDLGQGQVKGLVFRVENTEFGSLLEDSSRPLIQVAGRLRAEAWQGRKDATFFIEDCAKAGSAL
ncbi:single-stranded-dna-specific exonuclease [Lasius niger]|uniref:Single-stranded-DNA-specific exonuclease RecJ n=1 Tax=Lasius niger TaxID=67767 RepID=A0A0J7KQG2_LASNI|nr:single-stranded-dna-specific exonuclease [Lasius niger]